MRLAWLLGVAVLLAASACATGTNGLDAGRGGDAGFDGGEPDAAPLVCVPSCAATETCIVGRCVVTGSDADHDGIATALDCDDANPAVGSIAERACSSVCGPGVEQCMDGVWMPCSAPAACDCHDGDPPRTLGCGNCGMQMQVCTAGRWTNSGTCTGEGECMPGTTGTGAACGMCGMQTHTCGLDCHWGADTCTGSGVCMAGAVDTGTQPCGACGSQTRQRTCDGTCNWGAWGAWSGCAGEGACMPGATRACPNGDSCGHELCSPSCSWGGCTPSTSGGCLRIKPGTSGPEGNNWQCCGAHGYQFCCPSCSWCGCSVPAPSSYGC